MKTKFKSMFNALRRYWTTRGQGSVKQTDCFPNVEVISYHIPKTAGTSLRNSLEGGYGKRGVFQAYKATFAKELSMGRVVWVADNIKVIHGHFCARVQHTRYYPNAKRIVWLRDPAERAFSALNHWLRVENAESRKRLQQWIPNFESMDRIELFRQALQIPVLNKELQVYHRYIGRVEPNCFDFIGHVDDTATDLKALSEFLSLDLNEHQINVNPKPAPIDVSQFRRFLKRDYEVYDRYMRHREGQHERARK